MPFRCIVVVDGCPSSYVTEFATAAERDAFADGVSIGAGSFGKEADTYFEEAIDEQAACIGAGADAFASEIRAIFARGKR